MRVLSWNIRASSATNLPRVISAIEERAADVLVLGETTASNFLPLKTRLGAIGYEHWHGVRPTGRARGVVVASRLSCTPREPSATGLFSPERWSEVYFPVAKFCLAGVYAPDQPRPNNEFWHHIIDAAHRRRAEQFMLLGDLNSGISAIDAEAGVLPGEAGFSAMQWHGMFDLWRHRHGAAREFTWYHKRGARKSGFRIDHAFGSVSLRRRIRGIAYHHEVREKGISDHSMLEVSVR